ncbi:BED zinc finger, hAT family dimerization domain protein [Artemisia annua]|uniref:BED zinc finger, hAT family dimerization domain protein n=1 Tax=Artemisia annua TaxID=35608 RepID=A0A2U1LY07_ARTAN|nr:BED zinc finger, hAT family dimerization domain protein [Artemisia annua]
MDFGGHGHSLADPDELRNPDIEPKSVMDVALILNIEPTNSVAPGTSSDKTKPRKKTMTSVYLRFFETTSDGKNHK